MVTQLDLRPTLKGDRQVMPGAVSPANYLWLLRSQTQEEPTTATFLNQLIPNCTVNTHPYIHRYMQLPPLTNEASLQ